MDRGVGNEELFPDIHHTTLVSHSILADNFLQKLFSLEPFATVVRSAKLDLGSLALRTTVENYKDVLGFTKSSSQVFLMGNIHIHIAESKIVTYPEDYLSIAEEGDGLYYDWSDQSTSDRALFLLFSAIIQGNLGQTEEAIGLAYEAQQLDPEFVDSFLNDSVVMSSGGKTGHWMSEFQNLGIVCSGDGLSFRVNCPA